MLHDHNPGVAHRCHLTEYKLREKPIANHVMQRDGAGRHNDRQPIEVENEKRYNDEDVEVHCDLTTARSDDGGRIYHEQDTGVYAERARSSGRCVPGRTKRGGNASDDQTNDKVSAQRTEHPDDRHVREHDVEHDPVTFGEISVMRRHGFWASVESRVKGRLISFLG